MRGLTFDTAQLQALRRGLREVAPEIDRQLARELRTIATEATWRARGYTPKLTGQTAQAWRPSIASRNGAAIVNRLEWAGQIEYGAQVWLWRGLPYNAPKSRQLVSTEQGRRGDLTVMRAGLPNGRVVNIARYLIPRTAPGRRAVTDEVESSGLRVREAMERAAELAAFRHL